MQKFLKTAVVALAMLLVASVAFADVSIGAWGRMDFYPAASAGKDIVTKLGPGWGGNGRVGFNIHGTSDNLGFQTFITTDPHASPGYGDQTKIYLKFNDMFLLQYGIVEVDNLRGKIGGMNVIGTSEEDDIFTRFKPNSGAVLSVTPVDGLFIGLAVTTGDNFYGPELAEKTYKGIQAGAGYEIDDIGLIRAQYIGSKDDGDNGKIQAAFQLTAVDSLNLDLGGTIGLNEKDAHSVNLGLTFGLDIVSLLFRADFSIGDDFEIPNLVLQAAFPVSSFTLGLEVGAYKLLNDFSMQFAPYLRMSYGNGYFRAAFHGTLDGDDFAWAIPLRLEYWF